MHKRTCEVEGCDRSHRARGLCQSHYNRWHYAGDPGSPSADQDRCKHCGSPLPAKPKSGPRAQSCSRSCKSKAYDSAHRAEVLERRAATRQIERERRDPRTCPVCLTVFRAHGRRMYCTARCAKAVANAARRARVPASSGNPLTWRAIGNEDGPRCWICRIVTDPNNFRLNATGHFICGSSYPSLDHVVPLSRGGTHTRDNARLACFNCNTLKGAREVLLSAA